MLERVKGLEPSISAWKANVLPLHYTRVFCFDPPGKAGKVDFFNPNGAGTSFPVSRSEIAAASAAKGKSHFSTPKGLKFVVRAKRLELTHPKVLEPKSNASANSATPAQKKMVTRPGFEPGTP